MLSHETIQQDILELEQRDTTYTNIQRLMPLYVAEIYSTFKDAHPEPLDIVGDSDFLKIVKGKNESKVFSVVDELVSDIKLLHPRMYDKFIEKINEI